MYCSIISTKIRGNCTTSFLSALKENYPTLKLQKHGCHIPTAAVRYNQSPYATIFLHFPLSLSSEQDIISRAGIQNHRYKPKSVPHSHSSSCRNWTIWSELPTTTTSTAPAPTKSTAPPTPCKNPCILTLASWRYDLDFFKEQWKEAKKWEFSPPAG